MAASKEGSTTTPGRFARYTIRVHPDGEVEEGMVDSKAINPFENVFSSFRGIADAFRREGIEFEEFNAREGEFVTRYAFEPRIADVSERYRGLQPLSRAHFEGKITADELQVEVRRTIKRFGDDLPTTTSGK